MGSNALDRGTLQSTVVESGYLWMCASSIMGVRDAACSELTDTRWHQGFLREHVTGKAKRNSRNSYGDGTETKNRVCRDRTRRDGEFLSHFVRAGNMDVCPNLHAVSVNLCVGGALLHKPPSRRELKWSWSTSHH